METLLAVDLFSVLSQPELQRVAESLVERHYATGSSIVHADDPAGGHFFIVAEGEVAVASDERWAHEPIRIHWRIVSVPGARSSLSKDCSCFRSPGGRVLKRTWEKVSSVSAPK